jgi:hypothetical protein
MVILWFHFNPLELCFFSFCSPLPTSLQMIGSSALRYAVAFALLCFTATASASTLFAIRQTAAGAASIVSIDPATGQVVTTSPLTFDFTFPLVECTIDQSAGVAYVVTVSGEGSVLYTLNTQSLQVVQQWNTNLGFFDLQFDMGQSALYGISVVGRLGRVLSNFTLGTQNEVNVTHLVQVFIRLL